jgi:hypothetical protein
MMWDPRVNPLRKGRSAFRNGAGIAANPYRAALHRTWWERGWHEAETEAAHGRPLTWKQRLALQIEQP